MAYITLKDLSEKIDLQQVEELARANWQRQQRKRRRIEGWLIWLLPYAAILMTVIFYGLSAPHTARLIGMITPNLIGRSFAPLGFELGILTIAAFREAGLKTWLTSSILYTLLIISIAINIAGAFIAVVTITTGFIEADTVAQLIQRFTSLPATYQVVLILVPFIGAVIPVMTKLTGEIVVKMALGKVILERTSDEERWANDAPKVMHGALLQAAIKAGAGTKTAGSWATQIAIQMYSFDVPEPTKTARGKDMQSQIGEMGFAAIQARKDSLGTVPVDFENRESINGVNGLSSNDNYLSPDNATVRVKRSDVIAWLSQQPDMSHLSDRAVCKLYMLERFGIDSDSAYKSINRARKDMQS